MRYFFIAAVLFVLAFAVTTHAKEIDAPQTAPETAATAGPSAAAEADDSGPDMTADTPPPITSFSIPPGADESVPGPELEPEEADGGETGEMDVMEKLEELANAPARPANYRTRPMKTLEGGLDAIDPAAGTATVTDGGSSITYSFDEFTIFMINFKPVEIGMIKPGSRVVGLFDDTDGGLYLGRLIVITKPAAKSKKKSRRRRR